MGTVEKEVKSARILEALSDEEVHCICLSSEIEPEFLSLHSLNIPECLVKLNKFGMEELS